MITPSLYSQRSVSLALCLSLLISLSACARFNSVVMHSGVGSENTIRVFTYDDELRNTYFKKGKNGLRFCREPMPDAAPTFSDGVSVNLPHSGGVGAENSVSGLGLGGRNPEVLIAREFMFRACELTLNVDADYEQTREIYTEFLKTAAEIAKIQTGTGTQATASTIETSQSVGASSSEEEDGDDDSSDDDSDDDSSDDDDDDDSSDDSSDGVSSAAIDAGT